MRQDFSRQLQLDYIPISEIQINLKCRDEMIPILRSIQQSTLSRTFVRSSLTYCQ